MWRGVPPTTTFSFHLLIHLIGKLLHRVHNPHERTRGPGLQAHTGDPLRQHRARVLLPRPAHHVLYPVAWESAAGLQVGVYACVYWVWDYHNLYDGAPLFSFPLFAPML